MQRLQAQLRAAELRAERAERAAARAEEEAALAYESVLCEPLEARQAAWIEAPT